MPSASAELATSTPMAPEADHAERAPRELEADEVLLALLDRRLDGRVVAAQAAREQPRRPMLRAASNRPASTSSFTALAFAPGALNTGMPRRLIASTGMLLVPAPARPMARTRGRDAERVHVGRAHQDRIRAR